VRNRLTSLPYHGRRRNAPSANGLLKKTLDGEIVDARLTLDLADAMCSAHMTCRFTFRLSSPLSTQSLIIEGYPLTKCWETTSLFRRRPKCMILEGEG
jgi:hypothetical protein